MWSVTEKNRKRKKRGKKITDGACEMEGNGREKG